MADPYSVPIEPFRCGLLDDCAIKFTHVDLHTSNIMITCSKPYRVIALIDWEQSGWFPEYWEARKAEWVYSKCEGWTAEYVSMILSLYASTEDSWWLVHGVLAMLG
jgi:thiamine kinase-like enzyme